MQLTAEQLNMIETAKANAKKRGSVTTYRGAAGTGKTTSIKTLVAELMEEWPNLRIAIIAPTNKAAKVLARSSGLPVTTIHRRFLTGTTYRMVPKQGWLLELQALQVCAEVAKRDGAVGEEAINIMAGALLRRLEKKMEWEVRKGDDDDDVDVIIVDEGSMVGDKLITDLRKVQALYGGPALLIFGDNHQLPPVKDVDWFGKTAAVAGLTQVHRQAKGNPALDFATKVRETQSFPIDWHTRFQGQGVDLLEEVYINGGAIISLRNTTRVMVNLQFRAVKLKHKTHLPVVGDRIALEAWDRNQLTNGTLLHVKEVVDAGLLRVTDEDGKEHLVSPLFEFYYDDPKMGLPEVAAVQMRAWDAHSMFAATEANQYKRDMADAFDKAVRELQHSAAPGKLEDEATALAKSRVAMPDINPAWLELEGVRTKAFYAYCITCHKAQGSQYPVVVVINEVWASMENAYRWVYTAATRVQTRLVAVKDYDQMLKWIRQ